jgi:hypothetical protein
MSSSVLLNHNYLSVPSDGDDVYPVGGFQDHALEFQRAGRVSHQIEAHSKKWQLRPSLTSQFLPTQVVVRFYDSPSGIFKVVIVNVDRLICSKA